MGGGGGGGVSTFKNWTPSTPSTATNNV